MVVESGFTGPRFDRDECFPYNFNFSATRLKVDLGRGDKKIMSYAIIKTGGKQFAVENGQTLRVPSIEGKEGSSVDVQALVVGGGKDAKIGGDATVKAKIVGHGRAEKVIVFKKKRRKQYKRKQGHRQGYTEIKIEKI
jgi:large subunit ribosomal protein L21